MALNEGDREVQKLISDSGLMKEVLTLDGLLRLAERLGSEGGGVEGRSWWAIYRKKGDEINWICGGSS
jgi:hypothetical protein